MPKFKKSCGQVSDKSATKIRNAVNFMFLFSQEKTVFAKKENKRFRFRLNFITLTLPSAQMHPDEYIKKNLLTPFLDWLTKTQNAQMWLWKAEAQDNGNIHFHITTHVFVHWKSVRTKWNKLLAKHNYCKVFQDGSNDKGNAATQIKAAKNSRQVGGYLAGYIGKKDTYKNSDNYIRFEKHFYKELLDISACELVTKEVMQLKRPVEGRMWSCSYNLTRIDTIASESFCVYNELRVEVDHATKKFINDEFFKVHLFDFKDLPQLNHYMRRFFERQKEKLGISEKTQISIDSYMN